MAGCTLVFTFTNVHFRNVAVVPRGRALLLLPLSLREVRVALVERWPAGCVGNPLFALGLMVNYIFLENRAKDVSYKKLQQFRAPLQRERTISL